MTPKSYLSFINGYKTIYREKREEIGELARRMNTGLDKLMEASESVAQLSRELAVKEKELAVASEKADRVRNLKKIVLIAIVSLMTPHLADTSSAFVIYFFFLFTSSC